MADSAWRALIKDGRVEGVLEYGGDIDEFLEYVLAINPSPDSSPPVARPSRPFGAPWIAAWEYAVARVVARNMTQDPDVIAFRREILGHEDELVPPDRLGAWVQERQLEPAPLDPASRLYVRLLKGDLWVHDFFRVPPDGPLADLARFASKTSSAYNIDEDWATTFLVSGVPPKYSAVRVEVSRPGYTWSTNDLFHDKALLPTAERNYRSRITLSVDPALTADEVRELYAEALRYGFPSEERHARPAARSMRAAGDTIQLFGGKPSADAWRSWNRRYPGEEWKAPNGRVPFRQQVLAALRHLR
ncbi:MAG: hypothetical protein WBW80_07440 [Acidimicrobiales bacterium]